MNGSNGKSVELLERIADRLDQIAAGQDGLREEMGGLRVAMNNGFERVSLRLDHMLKFLGRHHAGHEQRIKALEKRVFKKSG